MWQETKKGSDEENGPMNDPDHKGTTMNNLLQSPSM